MEFLLHFVSEVIDEDGPNPLIFSLFLYESLLTEVCKRSIRGFVISLVLLQAECQENDRNSTNLFGSSDIFMLSIKFRLSGVRAFITLCAFENSTRSGMAPGDT